MARAMPQCRPTDQLRFRPHRSCSKKISALAMGFQRLGDNADIRDAGLLYGVHDRGKCAEGDVFIRADENGLVSRIANLLPQFVADFVDVDGIVAQNTRCSLLMLITRRSWVISLTLRVFGTF